MTHHPEPRSPQDETEYHRRFTILEHWLEEGSGSCLLKDPETRLILEETLMHNPSSRAVHHAWVIMPNHVHLVFTAYAAGAAHEELEGDFRTPDRAGKHLAEKL